MPRYLFFRTSNGQAIMGKTIASLLPPTAYAFGVNLVAQYEGAGYGLTWADVGENGFSMARILTLLVTDSLLYILLAWYLEQVIPSEFGAKQTPWFLFSLSYWRKCTGNLDCATYQKLNTTDAMDDLAGCLMEPLVPDSGDASIQIEGLRKVYSDGKVAVSGLTLDFLEDQITALLGHNGAGKSTTISMLTGLIRPTSGNAKIWGHSILNNMNDIRRTIGLCPQQNVLFSYMTVKEHLELYAAVKGVSKHSLPLVVDDMVMSLGLKDKTDTRAACLSGGMQRKLQVGLAMIGGSRVVFLDEPTCGLDPQSRRNVWELLKAFKSGRAIVLTTHYTDEADILCDRIAIMSEGRLQCCGSSLFLKSKFGVGYNLSMTRTSPFCSESAVSDLVKRHVPEAIPLSSAGGEISFQLPSSNKAAFAQLFQELEGNLNTLHIGSFGVSMTTLEEVFLRLADKGQHHQFSQDVYQPPTGTLKSNKSRESSTHTTIKMPSLRATFLSEKKEKRSFTRAFNKMFLKRAIIARRDVKAFANSILLPVVAIGLVMLIMKVNVDPAGPQTYLNFDMYSSVVTGKRELSPVTRVPVAGVLPSSPQPQGGSKYVVFDRLGGVHNSVEMSQQLLHTMFHVPPRFGALVINDTLWPKLNTSLLRDLNLTQVKGEAGKRTKANFNTQQADKPIGNRGLFETQNGRGVSSPVTLMYNTTSDHSFPALIQELAEATFRARTKNTSAILRMSSHPLPLTKNEALRVQSVLTGLAALFTLIPLSYCAASFAVFVVQERVVKAKLLQMVSGASTFSYWAAAYAWDMLSYLVIVSTTMLVLALYQDQTFTGSCAKASAAIALLIAFGLAVIPLTYCYAFAFSNHANAQIAIAGLHFITGFGTLGSSILMASLDTTKVLNEHLKLVYQLFPPYNLGRGLTNLAALDLESTLKGRASDPYRWDVTGRSLALMLVEAVAFATLTLLIDSGSLLPIWLCFRPAPTSIHSEVPIMHEDCDVGIERKRVEGGLAREDTVAVHRLCKVYPGQGLERSKVAVRNLSLGIPPGQCFGFLGVNGAGKTTTLSILSGDMKPTSGEALIAGNSVLTELAAAQKQIGYCPQFNPLFDFMTAREHLHMYASLKGVPSHNIAEVVNELIQAVGLEKHADRVAGSYSGGNKRKLSLSIALVGDPAVLFLDEPSSGMDPVTRRAMWNLVADAVGKKNMSAVLTTHSMEECEALCGRVGVMVAGSLVCLGSVQHIKSRFGQGYTVELQCSRSASLADLHHFMKSEFPGAHLEEKHMLRSKYSLTRNGLFLSHVFSSLEKAKYDLDLEDYSVSQSTLEQVFLSLANGSNADHAQVLMNTDTLVCDK